MTLECPTCHKLGSVYYAKVTTKSGKISYHKYFKHTEKTGRSGEVLQHTCYIGPISKEEYDKRPQRQAKRESTEINTQQRLETALKRIDDMRRGRQREIVLSEDSLEKISKILKEELLCDLS